MIDLSIVFGTYNRLEMLKDCIASVRGACGSLSYEIIITDGGSTDGTLDYLCVQPDVILVEHGELRGAVQAYYDAIQKATGEYLCYLSDDLTLSSEMFAAAVAYLKENQECGIVALPYRNPGSDIDCMPYASVGKARLPTACYGVLRRAEGESIDWFPRVTYHQYLDTGISLAMYLYGKSIDRLPGDYVIEHRLADNPVRAGKLWRDPKYSKKREAEAFHSYWDGKFDG